MNNGQRFSQMSDEDKTCVLFGDLLKAQMSEFMRLHELPVSGSKAQLVDRLRESLQSEQVSIENVIEFVDQSIRWGRQHIFMFDGPTADIDEFFEDEGFNIKIHESGLDSAFESRQVVFLPDDIEIVFVEKTANIINIQAIATHHGFYRDSEYDEIREEEEGGRVLLKGYVEDTRRGSIVFEWDKDANFAMLHISQLPSGFFYSQIKDEFFQRVAELIPYREFRGIDLKKTIKLAHEANEEGADDLRCTTVDYKSPGGRRVSGRSGSTSSPLLGEVHVDSALREIRTNGTGHSGSIYFGPAPEQNIDREVHVYILASESRVNFPTVKCEDEVRYVVERIQQLS